MQNWAKTRFFKQKKSIKQPLVKESGNVFLMLFGAVAMVGVLGASTMTILKGPVRTMSQVTKKTLAENNAITTARLAVVDITDCEGAPDGTFEPAPFGSPITGFIGGGTIPNNIGVTRLDPWGNEYGYCAWDHGTGICGGNRLAGDNVNATVSQYVIAVVSAGPDGVYDTQCNAFIDGDSNGEPDVPLLAKAGDDVTFGYTYDDARDIAIAGGIWEDVGSGVGANIARDNITIRDTTVAEDIQFAIDTAMKTLVLGDGTTGVQGAAGIGKFPRIEADFLQSFNNANISVLSAITSDSDITTTGNITGANLTATGNISGVDITSTGTATLPDINGTVLDVTGTSTLADINGGTLDVTGAANFDGNMRLGSDAADTIDVQGTMAIDTLSVTNNATIGGTLGVTGATTLGTLGADATTLDSLTVTNNASIGGNLDMTSGYITGLTPLVPGDPDDYAADKKYVDDQITAVTSGGVTEDDPQVEDTLNTGELCIGKAGNIVGCDITAVTSFETDPTIGTPLTSNRLCTYDGSNIICNTPTGSVGAAALWTDNTTHITRESLNIIDFSSNSTTATLDADGTRAFYDSTKAALRGGFLFSNDAWQNANIGNYSFGWGSNTQADGLASAALGNSTTASGDYSTALGISNTASGNNSFASGASTTASGFTSYSFGREVTVGTGVAQTTDANPNVGNYSVAFGLGDASTATFPQVTANETMAIFFGDQQGEVITATNVLALEGGSLLLSNDSGTACAMNKQGALRLNVTATGLEMCNGVSWSALTAVAAGSSDRIQDADNNTSVDVDATGLGDQNTIVFTNNTAESMRITTDGDVVIGDTTASLTLLLDVAGQIGATEYCDADGLNCFDHTDVGAAIDWDRIVDAMTLDANTTIDMNTNTATLLFDNTDNLLFLDGANNNIAIGSTTVSGTLALDISGQVGATEYCDADGLNCTTASDLGGLWTDNTTHISRDNLHIIDESEVSIPAPLTGLGGRMFFFTSREALRGGFISSGNDAWDTANIGSRSFAWGDDVQAGDEALAFGDGTTASGNASFAGGLNTNATNLQSFAFGRDLTASGEYSFASGISTLASGDRSVAMGNFSTASGNTSFSLGANTIASNFYSHALGREAIAAGVSSVAFGLGNASTATFPQVTADESFAIFFGDQQGEDITATNVLALEGGSLLLSNDSGTACAAAKQGALRLNAGGTALEMCDGAGSWNAYPAPGGSASELADFDNDTRIQVDTSGTGADNRTVFTNNGSESMRITTDGDVVIGDTAASATLLLDVAGQIGATEYCDADGLNCFDHTDIPTLPLDWDSLADAMILDANTTIDMNTNTATLLFDDTDNLLFLDGANNNIAIGSATVSGTLALDISGQVGATEYCDADGLNCFDYTDLGGLFTDNTTYITRENFNIIDFGQTSTTTALDGAGGAIDTTFYDPNKRALRGGRITGTNDAWVDTNIGDNSFAWGSDTEASGLDSISLGRNTTASGGRSIAIGNGADTTGDFSVAISNGTASGDGSVAIGANVESAGGNSLALGGSNVASGYRSTVFGFNADTGTGVAQTGGTNPDVGNYSMAFGLGNVSGSNPAVIANESAAFFFGNQNGETITATNVLALEGGSLLLSNDSGSACAANKDGALRLNATSDGLEMCDGGTTSWVAFSGAAPTIAINDLTDAITDYTTSFNMFAGDNSGAAILAGGTYNTAFGQETLNDLTTGDGNTTFGSYAGARLTTANQNTFIGSDAGTFTISGSRNTALGYDVFSNSTGGDNVAVGVATLKRNTGSFNTVIGTDALTLAGSGARNVAVGRNTLSSLTNGNRNVAIGQGAGTTLTVGSSNILIGDSVNASAAGVSNELNIGNLIYGNTANDSFAIGSTTSATGANSFALGSDIISSGLNSIAMGSLVESVGTGSIGIGNTVYANGFISSAFGYGVATGAGEGSPGEINDANSDVGNYSMAFGVGPNSGPAYPSVIANESAGFFFGNQNSSQLTKENVLGIVGGQLLIDGLHGGGDTNTGCIRYNDTSNELEFTNDCEAVSPTYTAFGGGSGLFTDNTTHITREIFHIIDAGQTVPAALSPDSFTAADVAYFHTDKAALRGGKAWQGEWAEANIGEGSFAWGVTNEFDRDAPIASGTSSVAFGSASEASGNSSTALSGGIASGFHSFASNLDSVASSSSSVALQGGTASESQAMAIGSNTTASGTFSKSIGRSTVASGYGSSAFGFKAQAGTGVGQTNNFNSDVGNYSIAFGLGDSAGLNYPQISANETMAIFFGDQANENITATNVLAIKGGSLLLSNDSGTACAANKDGALRLNATSDGLEMCDGGTTSWVAFGSGGGASELNDLSDAKTVATDENIFIGNTGSASLGVDNIRNVSLGYNALIGLTNTGSAGVNGDNNVAIGNNAMTSLTTGFSNVAIGNDAMQNNITGVSNVAIGRGALQDSTGAANTVAIGRNALNNVDIGNNTAVGFEAGGELTTGPANTMVGFEALRYNETGTQNVALGDSAGTGVENLSNVSNNVMIGNSSGEGILTGANNNTMVGARAGDDLTTGASNIFIGNNSGNFITTGSDNIMIGVGAAASNPAATEELNIGDLIYGDLANNEVFLNAPATAAPDGDLANGQITFWLDAANDEIELKAKDSAGDLINVTVGAGGGSSLWTAGAADDIYFNTGTTPQVGIGLTNPTAELHVDGDVLADAYLHTSDERLKKDIVKVSGLDLIQKLRGVTFTYTEDDRKSAGVIAQDVQKVLPTAVVENKDGYLTVAYDQIIAPLIEAVKDLGNMLSKVMSDVQSLLDKVSKLEDENLELRSELDILKQQNQDILERLDALDTNKQANATNTDTSKL